MTQDLLQQTLTDNELKQALEACAEEPIHILGAIQPHGYMLVLNDAFVIQKVSANIRAYPVSF